MQLAVKQLVQLGPLPSEGPNADERLVAQYEQLIHSVLRPVSDEEAIKLTGLFGPDTCFGLAWMVVHLIESAPGWPIKPCFQKSSSPWIQLLKVRANNAPESDKGLGKKVATEE